MQTLKEISKDAVIKYGAGPRWDIPPELTEELDHNETVIRSVMMGKYHRHMGGQISTDIEIFWERKSDGITGKEWSQWRFLNHINRHGEILRPLSAKHGRIFSDQFQICIIVPPMDKVKVAPELANNFPNG